MPGVSNASLDPTAAPARDGTREHASGTVWAEIVDGSAFAKLQPDWMDLLARAAEPNVFMDPAVVLAATAAALVRVVLAWDARRLIGIWAFSEGTPAQSPLPVTVLAAPAHAHGHLATPVIDRDRLAPALHAMLDTIAADKQLPKIVTLNAMGADGATAHALARVLAERNSAACTLAQGLRPKLVCGVFETRDAKGYIERAWSSSTRKKLRQHRRRLGEQGALARVVHAGPQEVRAAFEQFLTLEASGWKGREGTALLNSESDAAFMRAAVAGLADAGHAAIDTLTLDDKPVSMQIIARAHGAAFTWKTTYDERYRDYSPGTLLLEDYTASFLADPATAFVDSCAYDDTSYMSAWTERQAIADIWFDARRGGSASFRMLSALQVAYRAARMAAKRAYHATRRGR